MAAICVGVFVLAPGADLQEARTRVFLILSIAQLFYVLSMRSFESSFWSLGLWTNYRLTVAVAIGLVLQLAVIYTPGLRDFFHTVPLTWDVLLLCTAAAAVPFFFGEIAKFVRATQRRRKVAQPSAHDGS